MKKVEGVGGASIFKGDPRLPETDMDGWFRTMLEYNPRRVEARPYLYGSDAGFCARRNVLLEHNDSLDAHVNAAGSAYMAIGVALEDLLADALRRSNRLIIQGVRLISMPSLKISGKIDFVALDVHDQLALIECKTCGELPTQPKPGHLAQIQTYAAVSGVRNAWIVYISRNLNPLQPITTRTFQVDTSDEAMERVLAVAYTSRLAAKLHKLPPVPAHFKKHTHCHYCEFRDYYCWAARPGKGGEEPTVYLPQLTVEEHINITNEAGAKARELVENSIFRLIETIHDLLTKDEIDMYFKDILLDRYKLLMKGVIEGS